MPELIPFRSRKVRSILKLEAEIAKLLNQIMAIDLRAVPYRRKLDVKRTRHRDLVASLTGTQLGELRRARAQEGIPRVRPPTAL